MIPGPVSTPRDRGANDARHRWSGGGGLPRSVWRRAVYAMRAGESRGCFWDDRGRAPTTDGKQARIQRRGAEIAELRTLCASRCLDMQPRQATKILAFSVISAPLS